MGAFSDFWDFLRGRYAGESAYSITADDMKAFVDQRKLGQLMLYEIALQSAIDLIANALSKCEFRTFVDKKEVFGEEYYRWNYSPNSNQNTSVFVHRMVSDLVRNGQCLVVSPASNDLLIADTYHQEHYALYQDTFSDVTVCSDTSPLTFNRIFRMEDVLLFRLHNQRLTGLLDALNQQYADLLDSAVSKFQRSAGEHGVLKVSGSTTSRTFGAKEDGSARTFNDVYNEMVNKQFANYFKSANAVMTLFDGFDYETRGTDATRKSTSDVKDIQDLERDVFDHVARALQIAPPLLRGDVADTREAEKRTISYGIEPIARMIEREINRKRSGKAVLSGTRLIIDTSGIRYIDIFDAADGADKLRAATMFNVDEIRRKLHEPEIGEEWSRSYALTKNYEQIGGKQTNE